MSRTVNSYSLVTGIIVTLLSTAFNVQANPQADKDAGVQYGRDLLNSVKGLAGSSDPATAVPGYEGSTSLPLTEYYTNQDVNGLQEDAINGVLSGTADDPARTGYELSLQPNIPIAADDPLITGAVQSATDALANPDSLTVKTGNCALVDQTSIETTTEHCTAWQQPTSHTCSKALNVNVTWETVNNCPVGQGFNPVSAVLSTAKVWDIVHARAFCNPFVGENAVQMEVFATDTIGPTDPPDCTGWSRFTASTSEPALRYTGIDLRPSFHGGACAHVPVFVQGGCSGNTCNYALHYYELFFFQQDSSNEDGFMFCPTGQVVDLPGYSNPSFVFQSHWAFQKPALQSSIGKYCVLPMSVSLTFEKPTQTKVPTVTESWNDGCGYLEAQLP